MTSKEHEMKELEFNLRALKRCGAYAEDWEKLGKPKGWRGCSLPKGHGGHHTNMTDTVAKVFLVEDDE